MRNIKFYSFLFAFFFIVGATASLVNMAVANGPLWHGVVIGLGGEFVAPDQAGRPCAWYAADQQLICYNTMQTWFGEDAKPAYVMEGAKFTALWY